MACRFTITEKWDDEWFWALKPIQKLLFLYLCDKCDLAGFLEINLNKISYELGISKQETEKNFEALKEKIIFSNNNKYIFIVNFLKHQKNYPLNEKSNTYKKIIELLQSKLSIFGYYSIDEYFNKPLASPLQAPYKPLISPNGNSNNNIILSSSLESNNNNNNIYNNKPLASPLQAPCKPLVEKTWRDNFDIYLNELLEEYNSLINDNQWLLQQEKFNPGLDILLTLEKACTNFWGLEVGWKNKKETKTKNIDWRATLTNSLSQKVNKVYKQNNNNKNGNLQQQTSRSDFAISQSIRLGNETEFTGTGI